MSNRKNEYIKTSLEKVEVVPILKIPNSKLHLYQRNILPYLGFYNIDNDRGEIIENVKVEVQDTTIKHENSVFKACWILDNHLPDLFDEINLTNRGVMAFNNTRVFCFVTMQAHGDIFLSCIPENDEVFFVEELIHQCSHNTFNLLLYDKESLFKVDIEREILGHHINRINEKRTIYSAYWLNKMNQPIEREITILEKQNDNNKILLNQLKEKRELFQRELELSKKDFDRDSMLHKQEYISDRDIEIKQIEIMKKRRGFQDVLNQISNTHISIAEIEAKILSLSSKNTELASNNSQNVLLKLEQLKGSIEKWKRIYLLQSPISGIISFNRFIEKNTFIKSDDNLFTIIPKNAGKIEGQATMPIVRSGKVKKGQKVNIKLNNFPYQEYGMIIGEVEEISLTPLNNNYIVQVVLPKGLKTTYRKELPLNQKMKGNAEIVTEDLRLIERIFYQFRKLLKK